MPDHPLLDRIVRGRTWIVILGVLLAGIVAMQVEMLKLNSSIGRSIQLGTALQSRNELLRASVSSLSDDQRIERLASGMGMVLPGPTSLGFVDARRVSAGQAAANIHTPDPQAFTAALEASAAAAAAASGSTASLSPATTATGAPTAAPTGAVSTATAPTTGASTTASPTTAAPAVAVPTTTAPTGTTPTGGAPTTAAPTGGAPTTSAIAPSTPAAGVQSPTGG